MSKKFNTAINLGLSANPASGVNGDLYYNTSSNSILYYNGTSWLSLSGIKSTYSTSAPSSPTAGDKWINSNTGIIYTYVADGNSSQWVDLENNGTVSVNPTTLNNQAASYYADHIIPYTKTGTLSVTTGTLRYRLPWAATIISTTAAVGTAPTGAALIIDVLKNGTTIYSTTANRPTIAVSTNATTTSPTPDITALAAGDYLTVNIAQVGSTVAGSDLSVFIEIQRA